MTRLVLLLLMTVLQAHAQLSTESLTKKYEAFRRNYAGASLTFLFNQDKFAPGDTVWFKAYFLNTDRSPVKGRQLIDVALVSASGEILQHFLFSVKDGTGFNQLVIPSNVLPGIYTIAAYSNWMKNFDPPPLFSKQVTIVGEKEVFQDAAVRPDNRLTIRSGRSQGIATLTHSVNEGSMLRYLELHLIVTSKNKVYFAQTFRHGLNNNVSFEMNTARGIYYATVIDKLGRVVASQNYESPAEGPMLTSDKVSVKIEEDAQMLRAGEKAKIMVTIVDGKGQPVQGEFAFKVLNGNNVPRDSVRPALLSDALMQLQEPWLQIINGVARPAAEFTTSLTRKGTAMMRNGAPVPPGTKLVFYLQHNDIILQAQSWSAGRFTLTLPDIAVDDVMVAFAELGGEHIAIDLIKWDETSVKLPVPPVSHEGSSVDGYGFFSMTKKLIDNSFKFYATPETKIQVAPKPASISALEERLNGADITIDVQDYVVFGTMAELIKEVIRDLETSTSRGRTFVKVSLSPPMPIASSDPLYVIDGIVSGSSSYFLSLKPADIVTVKIVTNPTKLIPLGPIGKNGIVIVETLKGDARPPAEAWQLIKGIQPSLIFRSGTSGDRPNLRSTIYWAPAVQIDANGNAFMEFNWSDDVGPVWVDVTGMTKDGRFFSGQKELELLLSKERQ